MRTDPKREGTDWRGQSSKETGKKNGEKKIFSGEAVQQTTKNTGSDNCGKRLGELEKRPKESESPREAKGPSGTD